MQDKNMKNKYAVKDINACYKIEWYIAELITEVTVEDDSRNLVEHDFYLIKARSANDAYKKSLDYGIKITPTPHRNPKGKIVAYRFVGIRELYPMDEKPVDKELLFYNTELNVSKQKLKSIIKE